MANEKKDLGGVRLQIGCPSPCPSPVPGQQQQPEKCISENVAGCNLPIPLTLDEKKYLLAVERGDLANVRRMLQRAYRHNNIDVNCVDSLGRGSLTIAIDGENLEMVELLVIMGVETKDALLQAINAEFVEAVELLLEHEELIHKDGELYSWQKVDMSISMFTPDITPLILAAHRNNYEILKILLDRGATIPIPHDIKCGCDGCIEQSTNDSLRFSLSRVNEYRALASPSLIALSSNDPILTAFQLSWELRNLAFTEQESKSEYLELRKQCQSFAVDLLDQSRSSKELAIILNYDPDAPPYEDGDHMKLARLELAINYKQKKFVAHPNIQQLLASLWYEGVPGFRRKSSIEKLLIIVRVAVLFPFHCMIYMIAPNSYSMMKKPFMKFLIHASSYLFFLFILILVSQRAEVHAIQFFGTESMKRNLEEQLRRQRGNGPTALELLVVLYVAGFVWEETQEIYMEGIKSYLRNMWNFIDFSRNFLYCMVCLLRVVAYIQQTTEIRKDPSTAYIAREHWNDFDPQLIAEGLFAAANIFSALKLVHLFSINPHLGPLQISLGRMVIDIVKFFFIYSLVLFAFACGLNQLLWYFADLEKQKCYILPGGLPDWDNTGDACMKWRRFGNLFESSQSLFWASFGMVGLETFELEGIKTYTRFWGLLMFGSYSVINVIVLLNLLIAMMSNSYAMIDEHSDTEWKFARTKLWLSYFEEGATLPPPFNILPTVKWITRFFKKKNVRELSRGSTIRRKEDRENRYTSVMRALVWRYVSSSHRKEDESYVTEDDINEVKSEISSMRYEMLEIFEKNGMDVSSADRKEKAHLAKKIKIWERRLMKNFHVAPIAIDEEPEPTKDRGIDRFRRVASQIVSQTTSHKWNETVKGVVDTQIGRCRDGESYKNQQNLQKAINEAKRLVQRSPLPDSRSTSPIEYFDPQTNTLLELLQSISEETAEYGSTPKLSNCPSPATTLAREIQKYSLKLNKHQQNETSSNGNTLSVSSGLSKSQESIKSKDSRDESTVESVKPLKTSPPSIEITRTDSQLKMKCDGSSDDPAPLKSSISSAPKVVKRRAPVNNGEPDISIQRPVAAKPQNGQGMIPPPPNIAIKSEEEQKYVRRNSSSMPANKEEFVSSAESQPTTKISLKNQLSKTPSPKKTLTKESTIKPSNFKEPGPKQPTPKQPAPKELINNEFTMKDLKPKEPSPKLNIIEIPRSASVISNSPEQSPISLNSIPSGSSEKLVIAGSNKRATSPVCLRPYRKIDDVTTVKRQPKTGWL